jgi:Skp family chaperone for outer membrane proteins
MRFTVKAAAAAILAASLFGSYVYASDAAPAPKKAAKAKTPPPPSVADQIDALRQQLQTQIDGLKSDLSAKDAQLRQAQQAAAEARAAAARAQQAADAQAQAVSANASAVSTLDATVKDVKNAQALAVGDLADQTAAIRKSVSNPDAINYKGIAISPAGSFLATESVWRSAGTGDDINTGMTSVPLQYSDAYNVSENFFSARQTRLALKATAKTDKFTATGYYEADFLSSGTTSNNNQSNSYTLRQRELWGDVKFANGWNFSGGTGWSLIAENAAGITRGGQVTPSTIDAQYTAGFVWARQPSFRLVKNVGKKAWIGAAIENAETLNTSGQNLPTNILVGTGGTGGGLYNTGANYSYNVSPDYVVKLAFEPGWGHWELINVDRIFRDRIYPSGATPLNDSELGYGFGGSVRGAVAQKKVTIGLKGLYGYGVGRYGNSTIADVTIRPAGQLEPLKAFSALGTLEINPTPKLNIYANYGGDYVYRDYVLNSSSVQVGYGTTTVNMSGCLVETASTAANPASNPGTPANCGASNKDVQELSVGYWYYFHNSPKGRLRQGIQFSSIRRDLWSGATSTANPGAGAHGTDNMIFTSFRYYLP